MMKAAAPGDVLLAEKLSQTYVQAHGTGTPQNRVTESHIINEVAKIYGLNDWRVTSIKSYVGHSIGSAAGDQLASALGVWQYGWLPGIKTIDHIADDVHQSNLDILMQDQAFDLPQNEVPATIINSKGFGGNNASALVLSPQQTLAMLRQKHGHTAMGEWQNKNESVAQNSRDKDEKAMNGNEAIIYNFGNDLLDYEDLLLSKESIQIKGQKQAIKMPDGTEFDSYL